MLTISELSDARVELRSVHTTIEALRFLFLGAGHSVDARRLNDAAGMIAEEIAALDAELAADQKEVKSILMIALSTSSGLGLLTTCG